LVSVGALRAAKPDSHLAQAVLILVVRFNNLLHLDLKTLHPIDLRVIFLFFIDFLSHLIKVKALIFCQVQEDFLCFLLFFNFILFLLHFLVIYEVSSMLVHKLLIQLVCVDCLAKVDILWLYLRQSHQTSTSVFARGGLRLAQKLNFNLLICFHYVTHNSLGFFLFNLFY
jgi:hypothetical protein